MWVRRLSAAFLCLWLAACGGGGGDGVSPAASEDSPSIGAGESGGTSGDQGGSSGGSDSDAGGDGSGGTNTPSPQPDPTPDTSQPPSNGGGESGGGDSGSDDGDNRTPAPGPLTDIRFTNPRDIAADSGGNLYIVDGESMRNRLRRIAPDGSVTTLVSEDNHTITAVAVTPGGEVFFSSADDPTSGRGFIWRIVNGTPVQITFEVMAIAEMVVDPSSGNLFVGVWTPNGPEVKEVRHDGSVATLLSIDAPNGAPAALTIHNGVLWIGWDDGPYPWRYFRWTREGGLEEIPLPIQVQHAAGMAATDSGVYIAGYRYYKFPESTSSCSLELLDPNALELTRIAGGEEEECNFDTGYISSLAQGSDGNLYLTEYFNHTIRRFTPSGGASIYAGVPDEPGS